MGGGREAKSSSHRCRGGIESVMELRGVVLLKHTGDESSSLDWTQFTGQ